MSISTPGRPVRRGGFAALVFLALVLPLAGCGGEQTADVSGTVTMNGKPPKIAGLTINFMSPAGKVAVAAIAEDGTYTASGVPVGEVRVGFSVAGMAQEGQAKVGKPTGDEDPSKVDPKVQIEREQSRLKMEAGAAVKAPIRERFLDPLRSGLTTTVEPGKMNNYSPDLK